MDGKWFVTAIHNLIKKSYPKIKACNQTDCLEYLYIPQNKKEWVLAFPKQHIKLTSSI